MSDRVRILLAEDNAADVYLFRMALETAELNFELVVVENGAAALDYIRGEGAHAGRPIPDLAVLDLSLPKHDGIQVLEAIRRQELFASVPVVVASSSPLPPARLKHEDLRVARYIVKPPNLDDFLKIGGVLKDVLSQSRTKDTER